LAKQGLHIPAEKKRFGQNSEDRQWGRKAENIFHLCFTRGQRSKNVIVLHEPEGAPNHCVLETGRRLQSGNFACERLPESEVLGPPSDTLSQADQSGCDSSRRHSHFTGMQISGQMRLDAPSEIEAAFDRCPYRRKLFQPDHECCSFFLLPL